MASRHEIERRNLESSLLFMQQEHSNTLRALHEEISKLQKRCTELTFQLTIQPSNEEETEESQKKISQLEHLLKLSEEKQRELDKEIVEKSELISELKLQIWQNEKKHLELIKAKDQQVLTLKLELDAKSNTIASLTTDIHRLKVDQMTLSKPNTPPSRESSGRQRSRRSSVKALDVASRPVTAKLGTAPPDAEMFLVQACSNKLDSQQVSMKPTPPILPPISNNDQLSLFNRRQTLIRRKLDLKSQPELTTLAVDQLASSSNTFIHEPKATTE